MPMSTFRCPHCKETKEFDGEKFCVDCREDFALNGLCYRCGVAPKTVPLFGPEDGLCEKCRSIEAAYAGPSKTPRNFSKRRDQDARENTYVIKHGTGH
jgi:hypothetical protein